MILPSKKFNNIEDLKNELNETQRLCSEVIKNDKNLYIHTLLFIGVLNRTYEFTDSAIWSIENNRPQTTANNLRALIETLGFAYYTMEQVLLFKEDGDYKKLEALFFGSRKDGAKFKSVNILTCIEKASEKMFPGIYKTYADLSEISHPNSSSMAYSGNIDNGDGKMYLKVPFYEFKHDDKKNTINQVGECCYYTTSIFREILEIFNKK